MSIDKKRALNAIVVSLSLAGLCGASGFSEEVTKPAEPVKSTTPVVPSKTAEPVKAVTPTTPSKTTAPTKAAEPAKTVMASKPVATWKTLLIIKKKTDVRLINGQRVVAELSPQDMVTVKNAFQSRFPAMVASLSDGKLKVETDIVESATPLTRVSTADSPADYRVTPDNMLEDIARYVIPGKYDSVFVYWLNESNQPGNQNKIPVNSWKSDGPVAGSHWTTFSSLNYLWPKDWAADGDGVEWLVHEFMHQQEEFYRAFYPEGEGMTAIPALNNPNEFADDYPYDATTGMEAWYKAFMTGTIKGDKGLGPDDWKRGTVRELIWKKNLLTNGSMENGTREWKLVSNNLRNSKEALSRAAYVDRSFAKQGKSSLKLSAAQPDDLRLQQTVPVSPNSDYSLSGWVRTKNVKTANGTVGANLSFCDGKQVSQSVIGTSQNGWQYVWVLIHTGQQTELTPCLRLGRNPGKASGEAWFDDVYLMQLK